MLIHFALRHCAVAAWTELSTSFGNNIYYAAGLYDSVVLNEQLYLQLLRIDNAVTGGQDLYSGYVVGTLGASMQIDEASCKAKMAAANGTLMTNTPNRVQSAGVASRPTLVAAVLAALVAAVL